MPVVSDRSADLVLDALGDPTRREVLARLRHGPRSVGALAGELPVSRPAVSQHLRVLRQAGLVTVTPSGTRRLYAADPQGLEPLRQWVESFWDDALARFKAHAETTAPGTAAGSAPVAAGTAPGDAIVAGDAPDAAPGTTSAIAPAKATATERRSRGRHAR